MTPAQVKTLLDSGVLQAYAEGKEIQFHFIYNSDKDWIDYKLATRPPLFSDSDFVWRVKPEKKTGWINIYFADPNRYAAGIYSTEQEAKARHKDFKHPIACIQISYEEGEGL